MIIHAMLLKAGVLSLLLLLASRLLGLLRESAQAAAFGTSGLGDVSVLMLTLPDWISGVLASGALAYVLLPYWARQTAASVRQSQVLVGYGLLVAGAVVAVLLWMLRLPVVGMLASGLQPALRSEAAHALAWSALAIPAALLATLWATRLQHERDFAGMYAANLVVNGVLVGALFLVAKQPQADWVVPVLGVSLLIAMLARLGWLGWRVRMVRAPAPGEGGRAEPLPAVSIWAWAALSAGMPLALPFVARSLASQSGEGAMATFNYAWKLVELPLVLAIQLVASLAFPSISRALAGQQDPASAIRAAFALAWALACAAAAVLLAGAPALAQLLFGWGRMDATAVARVAAWGATGAWGLLPQALIAVGLTVLASLARLHATAWAYAAGLAALGAAGALGWHEGGQLMWVLNAVFGGVALVVLVAMVRNRPRALAWLPGREMLPPLVLVVLAQLASARFGSFVGVESLAWLALLAIAVVATGWFTSPALRSALRR